MVEVETIFCYLEEQSDKPHAADVPYVRVACLSTPVRYLWVRGSCEVGRGLVLS